ncbi:hypothetical protein U0070_021414, partial [Myodes glareolus]
RRLADGAKELPQQAVTEEQLKPTSLDTEEACHHQQQKPSQEHGPFATPMSRLHGRSPGHAQRISHPPETSQLVSCEVAYVRAVGWLPCALGVEEEEEEATTMAFQGTQMGIPSVCIDTRLSKVIWAKRIRDVLYHILYICSENILGLRILQISSIH